MLVKIKIAQTMLPRANEVMWELCFHFKMSKFTLQLSQSY